MTNGTADIVILQNHGTTIYAPSIAKLALLGVAYERAAQAFIRLRATGLPILTAKPEAAPMVAGSFDTPEFLSDDWN